MINTFKDLEEDKCKGQLKEIERGELGRAGHNTACTSTVTQMQTDQIEQQSRHIFLMFACIFRQSGTLLYPTGSRWCRRRRRQRWSRFGADRRF